MIHHSSIYTGNDELLALVSVFKSGLITYGEENRLFQQEFCDYIGSEYVKLTNSGSMAFFLILKALNIQNSDEILLPDYICKNLLGPIFANGATPILYDNEANSFLSSTEKILSKVTRKTKVVVINHTFGFIFKDIQELANQLPSDIVIVEDCCHAIISDKNHLKKFTRRGSLCCFYSFNATKLLAAGEGGAISSDDSIFISKLKKIRIGDNLSDLNCSIARIQLKRLDSFIARRKDIAEKYSQEFKCHLNRDFFDNSGLFFRYPLLIKENQAFWKSESIVYRKGVDSLLSHNMKVKNLPNAKKVFDKSVSIPIYPSLDDHAVIKIITETKKILQNEG
jgi:dTDP-4-amino-4,6-dideoxygalactose transaminase